MQDKMPKTNPSETAGAPRSAPKKRRPVPRRVIVILVSLLLLAAIAIAVPVSISAARRVLTFRGIRVDKSLYAYFTAKCRYRYLVDCDFPAKADTPAFWSRVKDTATGLTYGEECEEQTRVYVLRVITAAYLFDESGEVLSAAERSTLEGALDDLLTYRFDGGKKVLNAAAKPYGFSYRDVRRAYIYEYKASLLPDRISLTNEQIAGYFADHYRRVQVVLIPKNADAALREEAAKRFEEVRILADPEERLSLFESRLTKTEYNRNPAYKTFGHGYYFNAAGSYDASFAAAVTQEYSGVDGEKLLEAIYALGAPGDCAAFEAGGYTFYLMREKPALDDLSDDDYVKTMFSDFTTLAVADYLPEYLDSFADSAKWHPAHVRPWLPTPTDSDWYLFFN